MRKVSYLSYNMTTADANNPDGIVPVGRQFDFIGDVETEEMILVDGDESTPAYRAGKEDYKPGDMVWFDEPVLCTEGNVRLVVKKHLQRGEQPDGAVIDPWRHLDDFPEDE